MLDEVVFFCLISIFLWLYIASYIGKRSGDGFHIGIIFSLMFILTYPMKLIATKYGFSVMDSNSLGSVIQLEALLISNISAFFFILPVIMHSLNLPAAKKGLVEGYHLNRRAWLLLFWFSIILTYGITPFVNIFNPEALNDINHARGALRAGRSGNAIFSIIGKVSLTIYIVALVKDLSSSSHFNKLIILLCWVVGCYVLLAVSGSKQIALLPVFVFILVFAISKTKQLEGISLKRTLTIGAGFIFTVALTGFLRGFGQLQGDGTVVFKSFIQLINAFDAPDNLSFIMSRIDDFYLGDLNFVPTVQYVFVSWIPRFIWDTKPLIYGNMYIMELYFPERFNGFDKEVISPSMAGEMLVSGGVFFMAIASYLLGLLHAVMYHKAIFSDRLIWLVLYAWLAQNIFNVLRSGTGISGPFILYSIVTLAFIVLINEFNKKDKLLGR